MFGRERARPAPTAGGGPASSTPDLTELLDAAVPAPPADLQHALNHNQIACKGWLVDEMFETLGGRFGTVHLLGGWYGLLGALLLGDARFQIDRVISYDIDPECTRVAQWLNRRHVADGKFQAITADACKLTYSQTNGTSNGHAGVTSADHRASTNGEIGPTVVINTSCEHIAPTTAWFDRVPDGMLLVCQSNDYFDCAEHVNCMPDLEAFKADVPMRELFYEGSLPRKRYTRFMVIGRK